MNAAEEQDVLLRQLLGHGLVGGQHELLDDLVALVVFDHLGPLHFAFVVEFQLDFGEHEFQGPIGQATVAENHGQFMHAPQQLEHGGGQFLLPARRVLQVILDFLVTETIVALDGAAHDFACRPARRQV